MKNPYMRDARPWDLFNKDLGRVDEILAQERLEICKVCPELIKTTSQWKKCGCIMNLKTNLPNASCPLGKWSAVNPDENEEII